MNLAYALKIVAKQYRKDIDPVKLKQAQEIVKRETELKLIAIYVTSSRYPNTIVTTVSPGSNCISNQYR